MTTTARKGRSAVREGHSRLAPATALPPYSKSACQCARGDLVFGSVDGLDRHRVGDWDHRRCLTVEEILALRDKHGLPALTLDRRGIFVRAYRPGHAAPPGEAGR